MILTRDTRGFTLIELMVVIVILSILTATIAPKIIGRIDEAKVTEAKIMISNLETALKMYKLDSGQYPSTEQGLESLVRKPNIGNIPKKWREGGYLETKKIPVDPWGNLFVYFSAGLDEEYEIISYGADGTEGGEGFNEDLKKSDID